MRRRMLGELRVLGDRGDTSGVLVEEVEGEERAAGGCEFENRLCVEAAAATVFLREEDFERSRNLAESREDSPSSEDVIKKPGIFRICCSIRNSSFQSSFSAIPP